MDDLSEFEELEAELEELFGRVAATMNGLRAILQADGRTDEDIIITLMALQGRLLARLMSA